MKYGYYFKKIRKRRGLTIREIASNDVPISSISRFENETSDMYFGNVMTLLSNLGSSIDELLNEIDMDESSIHIESLRALFSTNEIKQLIRIYKDELAAYSENKNPVTLAIATVARIRIQKINHENISQYDLNFLNNILFKTNYWGEIEFYIFGSVADLLESSVLMRYTQSAVDYLKGNYSAFYSRNDLALSTLLNSISIFIFQKDMKSSRYLLDEIEPLIEKSDIFSDRLVFEFLKEIWEVKFLETKKDLKASDLSSYLIAEQLNARDLIEYFEEGFNSLLKN
ncbi:MAG: hypothetical protein LBM27_05610 [Lactobacillaceae bacterium]|jgi:Rgg/GadR/MutR family transcriptional activator|nr:hypothetical protein [Lactobacillaceae bacterium]